MRSIELIVICLSVVSCCFSLSVIGTILFFRKMQAGNFMPLILYMSIADVGLNIFSAFGFPADGSPACWVQGIFATYFTVCGWFWTTILTYRVYSMVRYGKCNLNVRRMHILAWGFPAVLTALPLSTTNYGSSEGSDQWCLFKPRGDNPDWLPQFWSYLTFLLWLIICFSLMIGWQLIVAYKFRNSPMKAVVSRTYDKVYLYPIAMIVSWLLNILCDDFLNPSPFVNSLGMIFAVANGIISALIFMFKSEEAQRRWYHYLFPDKHSEFDQVFSSTGLLSPFIF